MGLEMRDTATFIFWLENIDMGKSVKKARLLSNLSLSYPMLRIPLYFDFLLSFRGLNQSNKDHSIW